MCRAHRWLELRPWYEPGCARLLQAGRPFTSDVGSLRTAWTQKQRQPHEAAAKAEAEKLLSLEGSLHEWPPFKEMPRAWGILTQCPLAFVPTVTPPEGLHAHPKQPPRRRWR